VGIVLLLENLDIDPGFSSLFEQLPYTKNKPSYDIRLWVKFLAPLGNSPSTAVPVAW
jgi:hypothetical protein